MTGAGERWIRFLRQYGPIPKNENMFDEHIRRRAGRLDVRPVLFMHPLENRVLGVFDGSTPPPGVIVLTGTAGDGKSHLCGRVWETLGGNAALWISDDIYFEQQVSVGGKPYTLHVIRDLTGLPDEDPAGRYAAKADLLAQVSAIMFGPPSDDIFLLAGNDGQLMEAWRKLEPSPAIIRAHALLEARLMGDDDPEPGARLAFFNLSTVSSAEVLDLALDALLAHEGWRDCYEEAEADGFFGPRCPIRRNFELLQDPQIRARLRALFQLCDYNDLHTPIRRVLMLLANGLLGHPKARDRLMVARDVRDRIVEGDTHLASLFSNLFGANLSATKRESLEIFSYLGRFGIGQETTNRIDNILIFGSEDDNLRPYYDALLAADPFYGATDRYIAAQRVYVDNPEAVIDDRHAFLDMLGEQRRALFFKIPEELADELHLWQLTVFAGAGDYLADIANPLISGLPVSRRVVGALVNGLNRVFTGMLVSFERELLLATSLSYSAARVSHLLEDRIAVQARGRSEKIEVIDRRGFPYLVVHLPNGTVRSLRLNLTRYEFLMRVSEGALPGNFSRECYEDILAFKSSLLAASEAGSDDGDGSSELAFRLLSLDTNGAPLDELVEVSGA